MREIDLKIRFRGWMIKIRYPLPSTVKDLKLSFESMTTLSSAGLILVCRGRMLLDDCSLESLGDNSVILIMSNQRNLVLDNFPKDRREFMFESLFCFKSLTLLSVCGNEISGIPPAIGDLPFLVEFRVANNHLTSLPSEISLLRELRIFIANNNCFAELPPILLTLEKLELVELSHNELSCLPVQIGNLTKLRRLVADYNKINCIPSSIGRCSSLKEVSLIHNLLVHLPNMLDASEAVEFSETLHLFLHKNQLRELPSWVGSLQFLRILNLSGNELTRLPDEIGSLENLEQLSANNNRINRLPSSIGSCRSLQLLSLAMNSLVELPDSLSMLTNIEELDLRCNSGLAALPQNMFLTCTNLKRIHLWRTEIQYDNLTLYAGWREGLTNYLPSLGDKTDMDD
ncbi:OLC1v1006720C1 [Oldenlandia corymbosa var. corymbosa]|uniref:OLC1v1006720C1 n=1 Tax=Oldenlandia corymbosa var. corymbosa TaxID=529605 RepID=A0AAV1DL28_OLDCO|nr:OLC1v1006720C1 [Oldenlandia corymbosa var. corymbosa]